MIRGRWSFGHGQGAAARQTRPVRRSEHGAALILALAFLTVILTLVLILFEFADGTTQTLKTYRQERVLRYTADGAIQAAISMVKTNTALGVTGSFSGTGGDGCNLQVPIVETTAPGVITQTMAAGSTLTVWCPASAGIAQSGLPAAEPQARDVTFFVYCHLSTVGGRTSCSAPNRAALTSADVIIAKARVQFEVDYYYECAAPGSPPTTAWHAAPYPNNPCNEQKTNRARIPRIIWWNEYKCPATLNNCG